MPSEATDARHVYHLYVVEVDERERVQRELKEEGIPTAVYYPQPLHLAAPLAPYGYHAGDFPVSERASERTLSIPFYPEMTEGQLNTVADKVLLVAGAKQAVS